MSKNSRNFLTTPYAVCGRSIDISREHEVEGRMFLWNISWLWMDHTALYLRR
jgi:hypothetical protein